MNHYRPLLSALVLAVALLTGLTWALVAAEPTQLPGQSELRINELMADNRFSLEDPDEPGEYPDWIELYNPTGAAVRLDGLFLSDDPNRPNRFAIPSGLSIPAGGFMIFYADNDPRQGPQHLNFALSRTSGFVSLFSDATDSVVDSMSYGLQETDVSYGRRLDGGEPWIAFDSPTPGATNTLLPPIIRDVEQWPSSPTLSDTVTISATIIDERGLVGATLVYTTSGGSLVEVPMVGSGDVYTAQIPAFPDGTLVRYYLIATDIDDLQGRAPLSAPREPYRYVVGYQAPLLFINEIMADNESALRNPDLADNYPDWIELYNPSPNDVSLDGLFLTDSRSNRTRYAIPPGLVVPAEGYLLFYADNLPDLGPQHLNFALSKNGEYVGLSAANGEILIDEFEFPRAIQNGSIGRFPDGSPNWEGTGCISPGKPNQQCQIQAHLPVMLSQ